MTREEAITRIQEHMIIHKMNEPRAIYISEALGMAIEALRQEPCDDCISRQKVDELVDKLARAISDERCFISRGRDTANIMQDILDLSSVIPQPKIGHWKRVYNDQWLLKCPFCEHAFIEHQMPHEYDKNYCPSCGAKMVEPKIGNCQDCKWWNSESKCPINRRKVMGEVGLCSVFQPIESEE